MAGASYAFGSFLGGEISKFAQGRFEKPDYRTSLQICFNAFPLEAGAWTRRPGTKYAGHTRGGAPGRVVRFDFEQAAPITLEFTDGYVRFREGAALVLSSTPQTVVAVSTANPAVVQTAGAVTWATGDTLMFPGASTPLLENRQFLATKIDTTHFSLADAITRASIDGSTLGALVAGATIAKVHERATPFIGGAWANIRTVQAETTDILLSPSIAPQALVVTTLPSPGVSPGFTVNPAILNDGPYLDPFTNGVQATPSAKTGIITITLAFPAYDSTKAYAAGAFVTSSSVNYVSLVDQNVGNTPVSSPSFWAATSANAAINGGQGFLGTDVGRLVRLFSEPAAWAVGTTYASGNVVAYNPSGIPGATTYWQSLTSSNTGHTPGSDLTNWQIIASGAAQWTWGKITALSNQIDRALAGSTNIGTLTSGGGVNAAFDGVINQTASNSAESVTTATFLNPGAVLTATGYVGKNYSGASAQQIQQAVIYPSSDFGLLNATQTPSIFSQSVTINLRAKASAPATSSDGTLLATTTMSNATSPVTLVSNDQATTWNYVWIEVVGSMTNNAPGASISPALTIGVAELQFFSPIGTSASAAVSLEILGSPLLNTNPIVTWRLGVYSNTTGWPSCGVYNDGRIYLGGAVGNRFDASVANGIVGGTINFAPTDQYGAVSAANAIAYTFNSDGVNPILWMRPDLQGVLMGTQAGEWLVQAPTAGPISPLNITARNVTNHGSANIQPCRTEHTTIFVQRFAQKLLEYFPDVFSGKFSAPNLADKAQHITRAGVAELAYTSAVNPIVWGRDALNALFGMTYKRDSLASSQPPTFYGWHRHALGSGRVVESLCSGPSAGGNLDTLTMVTNDLVTGIRHVEVLTDTPDELSPISASWFLDDAVMPTSTSVSTSTQSPYGGVTINGLWHLNGKTVQVFASGLDCGDPGEGRTISDFVVANGSITVPFGDGVSAGSGRGLFTAAYFAANPQLVVGFTYNSDGQTVRPMSQADSGARNGPAFAKLSRGHRYGMKLVNTAGIMVGGSLDKMIPAALKKPNSTANIDPGTTFTGVSFGELLDDYDYEGGAPAWRVSRPLPATVVIIGSNLATQDQ